MPTTNGDSDYIIHNPEINMGVAVALDGLLFRSFIC